MRYLHRQAAKRKRPAEITPGAKSVVVVLENYAAPATERPAPDDAFKIAAYARGMDYHLVTLGRLLILTEWEEFAHLDLARLSQELKYPIVIDGRNLYDPEVMAAEGFSYYSVGRSASHPEGVPAALLKNGKKA